MIITRHLYPVNQKSLSDVQRRFLTWKGLRSLLVHQHVEEGGQNSLFRISSVGGQRYGQGLFGVLLAILEYGPLSL